MSKQYTITIFKTLSATSTPFHKDVTVALERIKSGKDLEIVTQVRLEKDKTKKNELKRQLPALCFSGKFRQRSDSGIISHSSLICLDFDNFKDEKEMLLYKKAFIESPEKSKYTRSCFISPSGLGLKLLVEIPPSIQDHKKYFSALQNFYNDDHFDKSCSNLSRICYSSYDENLYYNPESDVWVEFEQNEHYEFAVQSPVLKLKSEVNIVAHLEKWFSKKFTMNVGEKNNNLFIFASAFNDFAVPQHTCEQYILSKYGSKKTEREILTLIKSAYKKQGGTKFFEDKQSLEMIERNIRSGMDRKKIFKKMQDEAGHSESDVENAIKSISDSLPVSEFWEYSEKGKCIIKNYKFKCYLEQQGYYKLYPEGSENFIFVKIENNMIETVTPSRIKDHVLYYLTNQSSIDPFDTMSGNSKYFKDDYLNIVDKASISFYEDTIDKGVIYFRNGAAIIKTNITPIVEETVFGKKTINKKETKVELIDYLSLEGYVWRSHIIDRDYEQVDFKDCEYDKFLNFIAGKNPDKLLSIKSTIGYLMHSFKTSANNKAVILNDETISDNPNGGSGKGLFCSALGYMKRVSKLDGKTFDGTKSFAYQTVQADTSILVYDDMPRNFHFENLFSIITEGITLEKKNKDAIRLPVLKSPKIIVTTNYTIGGVGGSFDRRKWEVEFSSYFSSEHTPLNEFGHELFTEWDELEWKKFDNLMIDCFRIYLENGLIKQEFTNLAERKFIKETSFDFHEWTKDDPLPTHIRIMKTEYFHKFVEEYPDHKIMKWFTQKRFAKWLELYGRYKGYKCITGKDLTGRWIMYVSEGNTEQEIKDMTKQEVVVSNGKDDFEF